MTSAPAQKSLKIEGPDGRSAPSALRLNWLPQEPRSTQVRTSFAGDASPNQPMLTLVPASVARYISQHQLYLTESP
jgi:nicotinic acid mononucleotide adenylyltransferase